MGRKKAKLHRLYCCNESDPVCPHCGHRQTDAWEIRPDDGEMDCGRCKKPFRYSRKFSVRYTTSPMEGWGKVESDGCDDD